MSRVTINLFGGTTIKVVVKERQADEIGKSLGLSRESHFYKHFKVLMKIPKIYYCHADDFVGRKVIIMEDLIELTQAG